MSLVGPGPVDMWDLHTGCDGCPDGWDSTPVTITYGDPDEPETTTGSQCHPPDDSNDAAFICVPDVNNWSPTAGDTIKLSTNATTWSGKIYSNGTSLEIALQTIND